MAHTPPQDSPQSGYPEHYDKLGLPIHGCHLVGSVPFADAETVFRDCTATLPARLRRMPDGETGARHYFTLWQAGIFPPDMLSEFAPNAALKDLREYSPAEVAEKVAAVSDAGLETGYDTAALESYAVFRRLKDQGVIPAAMRMTVCIPTVANVIMPFLQRQFQAAMEPVYEASLFRAMRRIQDEIPHEDLAIQIDIAGDTAFWEATKREAKGTGLEWFQPWWDGDVKEYMTAYILRMFAQVDADVELGVHNCYGDMDHAHWYEPPSLEVVVERGIRLFEATPHPIAFFHCPVPKSATAEFGSVDNLAAYLAPLRDLQPYLEEHNTELYLGVVHEHQPQLTRKMIAAAQQVVPAFGIATECGGGRMQRADFEDALAICRDASDPF